jgi:hypothetical protein
VTVSLLVTIQGMMMIAVLEEQALHIFQHGPVLLFSHPRGRSCIVPGRCRG